MHTSLEIVRGMEFTTPALTAFSSLHADNQVVIASKLKLAETDLAEMMKDGEVKPITLPEKVQAYTFDYKYLRIIFCFDSQQEIQVLDILNNTWWDNENTTKAAS